MTDLMTYRLIWAVLALGMLLATSIRLQMVRVAIPSHRPEKAVSCVIFMVLALYFGLRAGNDAVLPFLLPDLRLHVDLLAMGLLTAWAILDGIWGVYGVAERHARLRYREKQRESRQRALGRP